MAIDKKILPFTGPCRQRRSVLAAAFGRLAELRHQRRRRKAALRRLLALDDRLLRDIGLSRGDLPCIIASWQSGRWTGHPWERPITGHPRGRRDP